MAAEQRREGAELEPTQVELAPFVDMRGVLFRAAILERETADIVRPVGNARHGKLYASRDLILEVVPARHDVAGPERRSRALRAAKARPRTDEGADRKRPRLNSSH